MTVSVLFSEPKIPQSLEALNSPVVPACFSALQRAENSSIVVGMDGLALSARVSVLFSEPKIPQFQTVPARYHLLNQVSVLFSEPKIPQWGLHWRASWTTIRFSALQRAENSSIFSRVACVVTQQSFSALQRAENSSIRGGEMTVSNITKFQCSSASRKFLNLNSAC